MRKLSEICKILDVFKAQDPAPKSELEFHNAYTLLVAIVLSAQSTDKGVNKATKELFKIADTPQKMLYLGLDNLKEHIKTIGLYNNKAKNIIALSQILVEKCKGEVPHDRELLESLPGVGRKTANVLFNVWWNEPTVAVDTHVLRLANRLDLPPPQKMICPKQVIWDSLSSFLLRSCSIFALPSGDCSHSLCCLCLSSSSLIALCFSASFCL